jgi:3-phosphoshikimate 1-carboxyvinyltransferase
VKQTVRAAPRLRGAITPPGDKSVSHRAAIFNAIARGDAVVENFQRGADCLATLRCLKAMGVRWRWRDETTLEVHGAGKDGLQEPSRPLDCRNSGTTMRLLSGLLSGQRFFSVLTGDASLRGRPMARVIEPLRRMGAHIDGRDGDRLAPLAIRGGALTGIEYRLPVASAQVKSALVLAGLYADGETVIEEPAPTRDHTERMLQAMGAPVRHGEGTRIAVRKLEGELSAMSLRVPGDISAAAPWLVLGAVHPDAEIRIAGVGVNPTRTGIIDALRLMGADLQLLEERTWGAEPVADIVLRSSRLTGAVIGGDLVPRGIDELPLLALAGCFAEGETVIKDAAELRLKESDRIQTTAEGLRRLGAEAEEAPDGLRVQGGRGLRGAELSSHGDHRLAMLWAIAGAAAQGKAVIHKPEAVEVSYSGFWRDLETLAKPR